MACAELNQLHQPVKAQQCVRAVRCAYSDAQLSGTRKLPFREISWPVSGNGTIADAVRSDLQRPLWPSSARRPSGRFQSGTASLVAAQGSL